MASADSGSAAVVPEARSDADLLVLVGRLGDDVLGLVDSKLSLLKLDVEEEARGYVRELLMWTLAASVVVIGTGLVATGLAFALAYFLPARLDPLLLRAVAFATVGSLAIVAGGLLFRRMSPRLGRSGAGRDA